MTKFLQYIEVSPGAEEGRTPVRAAHAIFMARRGNLELLLELLRSDDCPREVRSFAADLIEGKIKPPKHRPPKLFPVDIWPAIRVVELESQNVPRSEAILQVASALNCSESKVRASLKFYKVPKPKPVAKHK
jgi:hypothetical protein